MKKSGASQGQSASELISKRIAELGDWRGKTLSRMRTLIKEADPDVVEEWKWVKPTAPGTPVWSHDGIICTGESYKRGREADLRQGRVSEGSGRVSSTRVSTETYAARSTSTKEKKLTRPPSRRSFARRSPSTVLASRNLRRKRSPEGVTRTRRLHVHAHPGHSTQRSCESDPLAGACRRESEGSSWSSCAFPVPCEIASNAAAIGAKLRCAL